MKCCWRLNAKDLRSFFFKENQGRELFYGLQDFIEIPNVAIEMFADFCEDFATGTFIWFGNNSLFSLPDISINLSIDYCVDPNFCFWGPTV